MINYLEVEIISFTVSKCTYISPPAYLWLVLGWHHLSVLHLHDWLVLFSSVNFFSAGPVREYANRVPYSIENMGKSPDRIHPNRTHSSLVS